MRAFDILLQSATQSERIEGVVSFVGEDDSGSFGIEAGHERMMTVLVYGLARVRLRDERVRYLAFPGAVLYFADNALRLSTRKYLLDDDYQRVSRGLVERLLEEERALRTIRENIHRLEQEMFRRLWELGRKAA